MQAKSSCLCLAICHPQPRSHIRRNSAPEPEALLPLGVPFERPDPFCLARRRASFRHFWFLEKTVIPGYPACQSSKQFLPAHPSSPVPDAAVITCGVPGERSSIHWTRQLFGQVFNSHGFSSPCLIYKLLWGPGQANWTSEGVAIIQSE